VVKEVVVVFLQIGRIGIGKIGLPGMFHQAHILLTIATSPIILIILVIPSRMEYLGQVLNRLHSMSILPAQLTLQMLSAPSTLLSQTLLGTWTPGPLLT
jgi:hypothetical protein